MIKIKSNKNLNIWSISKKKIAAIAAKTKTIKEPTSTSFLVGQVTLNASCFTLCINFNGLNIFIRSITWQERRDSNPQPPVLETGALPIELHS